MDDFACAMFGPVLFVTLSFYGMQFLPLQPLYGDDYQVVSLSVFAAGDCHCCCSHMSPSILPIQAKHTGALAYAVTY